LDRENLFQGAKSGAAAEARAPAPSPLAAYVLVELPSDLADVDAGTITYADLADKHNRELDRASAELARIEDPQTAQITQLDLHFMTSAFLPVAPEGIPEALHRAVAAQCERFPALDPYMSYELLIDINCAEYWRTGDVRVFSHGRHGHDERDFYLGHFLAEPYIRSAAHQARSLVTGQHASDPEKVLREVFENLDEFTRFMAEYRNLSKDAFLHFRKYHRGYSGGPRGASGAFMPSVQLLELALQPPTAEYGIYLDEAMPYFPVWARPVIAEWRRSSASGHNISDMYRAGVLPMDDAARSVLVDVIDKFTDFRMVHLGITRKNIPETFAGTGGITRKNVLAQGGEQDVLDPRSPGTSGFHARNVLTNAVYRLLMLREDLVQKFLST
jgi:hypothetical protein